MLRHFGICLLLILAVVAVYGQVITFEFVSLDDRDYVTRNAHVQQGLSWENVRWALTASGGTGNWHPVTWLSHMLDCQFFGLDPAGHHATNFVLHTLNTLLLFGLLKYATGRTWSSAAVAALFAVHPLRVESVAWVSERKDVLSAFWGLLASCAYVAYARHRKLGWYLLTGLLLAVGLMAKPMLVTLPLVFLLLDYWPLNRIQFGATSERPTTLPTVKLDKVARRKRRPKRAKHLDQPAQHDNGSGFSPQTAARVLIEKLPLLGLSLASCVLTTIYQKSGGAVAPTDAIGLWSRVENALVSYVWYLAKTVWPSRLSVHYIHPDLPGGTPWTGWQVGAAVLLLVTMAVLIVRFVRTHGKRYLIVGWLWYLGMLVPVIGLVQVGTQAVADRYAYLPTIGLLVAVVWSVADLLGRLEHHPRVMRSAAVGLSLAVLISLMVCSWFQTRYWRDSITLYERALEVNRNNFVLHNNLGEQYYEFDQRDLAVRHFDRALDLHPDYALAYFNRGMVHLVTDRYQPAIADFSRAIELNESDAEAYFRRANSRVGLGQHDEALNDFSKSIQLKPDVAGGYLGRGNLHAELGQFQRAVVDYSQVVRADGDVGQAYFRRANVYRQLGEYGRAVDDYTAAIKASPHATAAYNNLALVLATCSDKGIRNPRKAVSVAQEAVRLSEAKDYSMLDTLATAYAETGDFENAQRWQIEAIELAPDTVRPQLRVRLELYQQGKTEQSQG